VTRLPAEPSERRLLSQKELAKEKRHALYQSAKERRATDPRYLAMKEAAKLQRRAAYQQVKEKRKAVAAEEKAKRKASLVVDSKARHVTADPEILKVVTWLSTRSNAQND
jgi:hypothetical protein